MSARSCTIALRAARPLLTLTLRSERNDTATTEIYTLSLRRFRSRWSPYHLAANMNDQFFFFIIRLKYFCLSFVHRIKMDGMITFGKNSLPSSIEVHMSSLNKFIQ